MAKTDEVLERILAADKLAAAETAAPETPMPETPEQAYQRGHAVGYALGIEHATQEFQSRAPVPARVEPAPRLTTPDEELEKFKKWISCKSTYYLWEDECLSALHAALVPGDRIHPMFAFSCIIIHANGRETEFKRVPNKGK